jgi:hypothetical protein
VLIHVTYNPNTLIVWIVLIQLLEACDEPGIKELLDIQSITDAKQHFHLAQATHRDATVDKQDWQAVKHAFLHMGFSTTVQNDICKVYYIMHVTFICTKCAAW